MQGNPTCIIDGCDKAARSARMCSMHYTRVRNHGDPHFSKLNRDNDGTCAVTGCAAPYSAKGYCRTHYQRWRVYGDPCAPDLRMVRGTCSIDGCDRPHSARGYCELHYKRWSEHGDARWTPRDYPKECSEDGCSGRPVGRGFCDRHYRAFMKWGDPNYNGRAAKRRRRPGLDWRSLADVQSVDWNCENQGYRYTVWHEHPGADPVGRVYEHKAVLSAAIGRVIGKGESVHHRNGIRSDNRPENLELWISQQPCGQRVADLVAYAHEILERYGDDVAAGRIT